MSSGRKLWLWMDWNVEICWSRKLMINSEHYLLTCALRTCTHAYTYKPVGELARALLTFKRPTRPHRLWADFWHNILRSCVLKSSTRRVDQGFTLRTASVRHEKVPNFGRSAVSPNVSSPAVEILTCSCFNMMFSFNVWLIYTVSGKKRPPP